VGRHTAPRLAGTRGRALRTTLAGLIALSGSVVGTFVAAAPSRADVTIGINGKAADGSYVANEVPVDSHMGDLTIASTAMQSAMHVRIIVPPDYFTNPTKTFPVLYLLSGSSADNSDWQDWSQASPIESYMENREVITVMPQDGNAGMYTNWVGTSQIYPGKPQWQTFHTIELPQIMSSGYRANGVNAIAGISEGGLGVIDYPATNPGLYKAAATFSGLVDLQFPGSPLTVALSEIRTNDNPSGPFGVGTAFTNDPAWSARNPLKLVGKLAAGGTSLFVSAGNGEPGPYDYSQTFAADSYVYEQAAQYQAHELVTAAQAAGVNVTSDFYGAGKHDWPSWIHEFPKAWAEVLAPGLGVPA
jgi:S-formylglutathione hydrolase FrmB